MFPRNMMIGRNTNGSDFLTVDLFFKNNLFILGGRKTSWTTNGMNEETTLCRIN